MKAPAQQYPSAFARNFRPDQPQAAAEPMGPTYIYSKSVEHTHGVSEQSCFVDVPQAERGFNHNCFDRGGFGHGQEQDDFVDAAINEMSPDWVQQSKYHRGIKPSRIVLGVGSLMLLLTVTMPVWEAYRLMLDPTFAYFIGREYCMSIIALCMSAIFLYCMMIVLLFSCAREEGKTQHSVLGSVTTVITVLGLCLLLIAQPLKRDSKDAYEDLFFRCASAPRMQLLVEHSMVLQTLRNSSSACAAQVSVEQCEGFQESHPYTGYLKAIEGSYRCAGFCWGGDVTAAPADKTANTTVAPEAGAGLLSQERPRPGITLVSTLLSELARRRAGQRAGSSASLLSTDHAVVRAVVKGIQSYPPTLFTDANYQTSCDGMAARVLRYRAVEVADMLYIEGVVLVFVAILVMFLELVETCTSFAWLAAWSPDLDNFGKGLRFGRSRQSDP